jgi:hypothetical protein
MPPTGQSRERQEREATGPVGSGAPRHKGEFSGDIGRYSDLVRVVEVVFHRHPAAIHRTFQIKVEEPVCAPCCSPSPLNRVNAPCQNPQNRQKRGSPASPRVMPGKQYESPEILPHLIAQRMQHWLDIARCPIMNRRVPTWKARRNYRALVRHYPQIAGRPRLYRGALHPQPPAWTNARPKGPGFGQNLQCPRAAASRNPDSRIRVLGDDPGSPVYRATGRRSRVIAACGRRFARPAASFALTTCTPAPRLGIDLRSQPDGRRILRASQGGVLERTPKPKQAYCPDGTESPETWHAEENVSPPRRKGVAEKSPSTSVPRMAPMCYYRKGAELLRLLPS